MKDYLTKALRAHLAANRAKEERVSGWRHVFGCAQPEDVNEVDSIVADDLETVEEDSWR